MSSVALALGPLVLDPFLPWPLLGLLGVLAGGLVGHGLWRRARGTVWRLVGLLLLFAGLLSPRVIDTTAQPLTDIALVVSDRSDSQIRAGRGDQVRQTTARLIEVLKKQPGLEVQTVTVTKGDRSDGGTRLFDALGRVTETLDGGRLAGVVMITDGQVHDVPATDTRIGGRRLPVHVLITGSRHDRDRRVVVTEAPEYGIVGRPLTMKIRIDDEQATGAGRRAALKVRVGGSVIFEQLVRTGTDITVPFDLAHAGPSIIEIATPAVDGELTAANNRRFLTVNGVRDRLRVLLISGEPHAGARVWRNLLKADPAVDLVHFTILRTPREASFTPVDELSLIAFPTRELFEEKINDFDLIVFDRYRRRGVLPARYMDGIDTYVRHGGALLLAAGPEFASPLSLYDTGLAGVLPARPTGRVLSGGFLPLPSAVGRRHPVTRGLPMAPGKAGGKPAWGRWFRQIEAVTTAGETVMTGAGGKPLLVLERVDEGRVAQLLSDHTWLWSRGIEGGGPQAELLRRLAHWLMKEPDLEENALIASSRGRRISITERSLSATPLAVTIDGPDRSRQTVIPVITGNSDGKAVADVGADGIYHLSNGRQETLVAVGPTDALEMADLRATGNKLGAFTEASGGSLGWLEDGGLPGLRRITPGRTAHGPGWIGLWKNGRSHVTGSRQYPLLPAWLFLLLSLGSLAIAWYRESH